MDYTDLRLPPVKGTRALITGSICFRVGLNLDSYNRYLLSHSAQTKIAEGNVAKEANKLAQTLFHSLRDKFCVAFIYVAGLLTACVGDPNVFVLNHLATRHTVHEVWEIAARVVTNLVQSSEELGGNCWRLHPDAEHMYKREVLQRFPEWRPEYDKWELRTRRGTHVARFMSLCRLTSRQYLIAFFCESGRQRWVQKIEANKNKDCSDFVELRHAPVNTDTTESGFGSLDYNLYKTLAAFTTTFGVVAAQRMQIFASEAGKVDRQNKKKQAADHVKKSTCWALTSYYDMDPSKRAAG